jgi:ubiquitin-protein ligase E3 C
MPFEEQIKYIQKGLFSILGEGVQGIFSVEEMNFMITGQEDIDLKDLRENIIYKGEYNENHPLIKMFWEKLLLLHK